MTLTKLSKKDFSLLRDKKTKTFRTNHLLFFYVTSKDVNDEPSLSCGLTITKKRVKHAVGRNRIKRLLRECVKKAQKSFELNSHVKVNVVFAPKSDIKSSIKFHELYKEVELFLRKAI